MSHGCRSALWACLVVLVLACLACWRPTLSGAESGMIGSGSANSTQFSGGLIGPTGPAANAATPVRYGSLILQIRWPELDRPGFHAALLPTTTQAIAVWVRAGSQDLLATPRIVQRQGEEATVSVEIQVPEALNLAIEARAYRQANPDVAADTPIARGFAAGVNVVAGRQNPARIVLDALFVPAVSDFSSNFGAPGTTVSLTGVNFTVAASASLTVSFNGALASQVQVASSSGLLVVVPDGATSGRVVVTNDGVPSSSDANFWVVGAFDVDAPRSGWDPSPADKRIVVAGQRLPFYGTPTGFATKDGDNLAGLGASPSATMSVTASLDNPAAGSISGGTFTAASSVATASLSATSGQVAGSNSLALSVETITFSLSPGGGALGPFGQASIPFLALSTLSGGAPSSLAEFTSTDPATVSIQGSVALPGSGFGYVTVAARSLLDPSRSATASVVLTATTATTLASGLSSPAGLAADGAGNVYLAENISSGAIRKVSPGGIVTTLASGISYPWGVAVDATGSVYVAGGGSSGYLKKVSPGGSVTTLASGLNGPPGVADSYVYWDSYYYRYVYYGWLMKVSPGGDVTVLTADLKSPHGVAVDGAGNVYVADSNYGLKKVSPGGSVTSLASDLSNQIGVAVDGAGNIYVAGGGYLKKVSPGGVITTRASDLIDPNGVAVDGAGSVYVADSGIGLVRKVGELAQVDRYFGGLTVGVE